MFPLHPYFMLRIPPSATMTGEPVWHVRRLPHPAGVVDRAASDSLRNHCSSRILISLILNRFSPLKTPAAT